MREIEQNIYSLVETQFPRFYRESGDNFVEFTKAYYEWMDSLGGESRNILEYRDIDYTVDAFLDNFKQEYLVDLPHLVAADKRFLVKHIQDLYKSKGSSQSFKLFFKLVFGQDVEIYDPGKDVLRASDGIWKVPTYLECAKSDRSFSFLGKNITGSSSGATAFVENVVRRKIGERFIDILYITSVAGTFETGEKLSDDNSLEDAPLVIGSLNSITITSGGSNNAIGDVLTLTSSDGKSGKAIVRAVENGTGKVTFTLANGGFGFTVNATPIVSNAVVIVSASNGTFTPFMDVVQPLQRFNYTSLSGANTYALLDSVIAYNSSNAAIANGYVVSVSTSNTTAGNLIISSVYGNWSTANTIKLASNSAIVANLVSTQNVSATATVVGSNSTALGLYNISGTMYNSAHLVGKLGEPLGLASSNTTTQTLTGNGTLFSANSGTQVYFRANGVVFGTVNTTISNTSIQLTSNSLYTFTNATVWKALTVATANTGRIYNLGSGATFSVGTLSDTQAVTTYDEALSAYNTGNVCFLDMLIDGSNSNTSGYGFSGNSSIGYSSGKIKDALSVANVTIGKIESLSSVNPGNNYNADPFVLVLEDVIYAHRFAEAHITIANTNSLFSPGDKLIQDISIDRKVLTVSSNTGAFSLGEGVIQTTSGAKGIITSIGSSTLVVEPIENTVFVSGNNVVGQTTSANAAISGISTVTTFAQANGLITEVSGDVLTIRDTSFAYQFSNSSSVYSKNTQGTRLGEGVIGNIVLTTDDYMGLNSSVSSKVKTASGIVSEVEILESGFGHSANSVITLNAANSSAEIIYGVAGVYRQGKGEGTWQNNNGKLNSDKYLHDNYYYQEYSYEIQSSLSLDKYSDMLKKVLHVAGTELFGKVIIQTEYPLALSAPNTEITES